MTSETKANPRAIANDFRTAMNGRLTDAQIEAGVNTILSATEVYPASLTWCPKLRIAIKGGETFTGGTPFGSNPGIAFGDVYTDNLARLYSDTVSFQFQGTPVYLSILFFDRNTNLLGHFQAAVSVVTGIGGGSGKWS